MYDVHQQLFIPEQWYPDMFMIDSVDLARAFADDPAGHMGRTMWG